MVNIEIFKKYDSPKRGYKFTKSLIELRGHQCECCKNTEWLNQPIKLQVHHIDGDKTNNTLENLQLLCPNCHSYTDNFGSKNNRHSEKISDEVFIKALNESYTIREALIKLNLSDAGGNYKRARQFLLSNKASLLQRPFVPSSHPTSNSNKNKKCPICGKLILSTSKSCIECSKILSRTTIRPSRIELKEMIRKESFLNIGKKYQVSDNTIRKWCKFENLPYKKREINLYSDEEWAKV